MKIFTQIQAVQLLLATLLILTCACTSEEDKKNILIRHYVRNHPSFDHYSDQHPMKQKDQQLKSWILDCAYENRIPTFDYYTHLPLAHEKVLKQLISIDTMFQLSLTSGNDTIIQIIDSIHADRIHELRYLEQWSLSVKPVSWTKKVISYTPVDLLYDESGQIKGTFPLFSIKPKSEHVSEQIWENELEFVLDFNNCRSLSLKNYHPGDYLVLLFDLAKDGKIDIRDSLGKSLSPESLDDYFTKTDTFIVENILSGKDTSIISITRFDLWNVEKLVFRENWKLFAGGNIEKTVRAIGILYNFNGTGSQSFQTKELPLYFSLVFDN